MDWAAEPDQRGEPRLHALRDPRAAARPRSRLSHWARRRVRRGDKYAAPPDRSGDPAAAGAGAPGRMNRLEGLSFALQLRDEDERDRREAEQIGRASCRERV